MAVSAKLVKRPKVPGSERRTVTEVTLDASYPTGGEPLTPKELGLTSVDFAFAFPKTLSESETVEVGGGWYDTTNQKLVVNNYKTQKELANGKDLSKVVFLVYAFGF